MRNSLAEMYPESLSEWSEKNTLKPAAVSAGSHKKILWKCKVCGHEWKSVIHSRIKGTVCPACADREVLDYVPDITDDPKAIEVIEELLDKLAEYKPLAKVEELGEQVLGKLHTCIELCFFVWIHGLPSLS